jgi:hypothetical protein
MCNSIVLFDLTSVAHIGIKMLASENLSCLLMIFKKFCSLEQRDTKISALIFLRNDDLEIKNDEMKT